MAQEFDGSQFPQLIRFTLGGTDVATLVLITSTAATATVRFETNAGKLAFTGSDAAAINANYIAVTADATHQFAVTDGINVSKGVAGFYVASATGSTVVSVMVEG